MQDGITLQHVPKNSASKSEESGSGTRQRACQERKYSIHHTGCLISNLLAEAVAGLGSESSCLKGDVDLLTTADSPINRLPNCRQALLLSTCRQPTAVGQSIAALNSSLFFQEGVLAAR